MPRPPERGGRGGYLYVSVMGVAAIVSIIGFAAMSVARTQLRTAEAGGDWFAVRILAQSGIERGITQINNDPNWQTTYPAGVEHPAAVNDGTMSWKLVSFGPGKYRLEGIGRKGNAACVQSVLLSRVGANVLEPALVADDSLTVASSGDRLTTTGAPLSTNGPFLNNGTVTGTVEVASPVRALPDPVAVFDYYRAHGTAIDKALLGSAGDYELREMLLSPNHNPFGGTNAEGIYVIDCLGGTLTVRDCRIVGTLVVLNAAEVQVRDAANWEPALPNYPALMVQGPLRLRFDSADLQESNSGSSGVNFNPASTPYQGQTDATPDDAYPSALAGIIYCTGDLRFDGKNDNSTQRVQGVVICGGNCTVEKTAQVALTYEDTARQTPPPGFRPTTAPTLQRRTWQQRVSY